MELLVTKRAARTVHSGTTHTTEEDCIKKKDNNLNPRTKKRKAMEPQLMKEGGKEQDISTPASEANFKQTKKEKRK